MIASPTPKKGKAYHDANLRFSSNAQIHLGVNTVETSQKYVIETMPLSVQNKNAQPCDNMMRSRNVSEREPQPMSLSSSRVTIFQSSPRRVQEHNEEAKTRSSFEGNENTNEQGFGSRHVWNESRPGMESWRRHFLMPPSKNFGNGSIGPAHTLSANTFWHPNVHGEISSTAYTPRSKVNRRFINIQATSNIQHRVIAAPTGLQQDFEWKMDRHNEFRTLQSQDNKFISVPTVSNRQYTSGFGYHARNIARRSYDETAFRYMRAHPENVVHKQKPNFEAPEVSANKGTTPDVKPHHHAQFKEPIQDRKRALSPSSHRVRVEISLDHQPGMNKRAKGFDKLDLLCSATLDMGELYDNPAGCSCPKSKCIALYCDCFKAGRRCNPDKCRCVDCKNTVSESGAHGARTKAIRMILARNPRAFTTAGLGNPILKLPPGEIACNCVRSKCLKLYCTCFQNGKACTATCTCVGCQNTDNDEHGHHRVDAMQQYLEKCPEVFVKGGKKAKEIGTGCACKNNRCIRKYCECFRNNLVCNPERCVCRNCENIHPRMVIVTATNSGTAVISTFDNSNQTTLSPPMKPPCTVTPTSNSKNYNIIEAV